MQTNVDIFCFVNRFMIIMHIRFRHKQEGSHNKALCASAAEPSTVTTEELTQHKNYLKVIKRQEREVKEAEKKYQKKGEDLIQKYTDSFKAIKKKTSVKKKE